jgi:hypothetical protein
MPKAPIDFCKGLIYKIVPNDISLNYCYVGSTCNFVKRKCNHKDHCNNQNDKYYNCNLYQIIRANGRWNQWTMVLIEQYPCKSSLELRQRERYWIEQLKGNLNTRKPQITLQEKKEYNSQWKKTEKAITYQQNYQNTEKYKKIQKEYYKKNKQEIKAKQLNYEKTPQRKQYKKKYELTEKRKEYKKTKYNCECGSIIIIPNKSIHIKTQKHQNYLKSLEKK